MSDQAICRCVLLILTVCLSVPNAVLGDAPSKQSVAPVVFDPPTSTGWAKTVAYEQEPAAANATVSQAAPMPKSVPPSFSKKVAMLEVALARRIAEQPNLWRFDDLEDQTAKLLSAAETETDRRAVRGIAARIERFDAIGQRYRGLRSNSPTAPAIASTRATTRVTTVGTPAVAGAKPYDAVGELRPVVSKRPGAPQYALVGGDGKIVTFITPAKGLDLDPLLGKQVGARGGRGYMPEYKHRHLTAQKITRLDTLRR